ncbi:MAG: Eco57I restriction-modification methylase domain-containing protein [Methylobacter sp.]|nr:Eco57I restriction-modification methylase domain-containing protein [Methylobacter sp.]
MRNKLTPSRIRQPSEKPVQILYDSKPSVPDRLSIGQPHTESVEERLVSPVHLNVPETTEPVEEGLVASVRSEPVEECLVASVRSEPVEEQPPKIINYNPDVLTCLANLSNDEVFTPPELVNQMLAMLPAELWQNSEAKFLDPVTKSGVFLREIAKRLNAGLAEQIPDLQTRLNHIFTQQLFGLAITELTSLLARRSVYCAKKANSAYSICTAFKSEQGNILFSRIEHTWHNGKCTYCGASQEVYARDEALETHAYQFIHTDQPAYLFGKDMKFDVIIGNPPYQLSTDGFGGQAKPIYHLFVEQAKKLNPHYLIMITPARWFAGGMGLNDFRANMIADKRIRHITDIHQAADCFPGVEIKGGVCYFLWDAQHSGNCEIQSIVAGQKQTPVTRSLNKYDIFVRHNEAIPILEKVLNQQEPNLSEIVSGVQPFGLPSTFKDFKNEQFNDAVKIYARNCQGWVERAKITLRTDWIDKYKVLVSEGYNGGDSYPHQIIGKPIIADKGSCCTMTYIAAGFFDSREEAENLDAYLKTKFVRFMIFLRKNTQHTNSERFKFVPYLSMSITWTDQKLYKKYGLTTEEIAFIESMIRPMELADE